MCGGVGQESPFGVFVHAFEEVSRFHLYGSVPYRRETQAHFFCWPLYALRREVVEKASGESQCSVEDAIYVCELSVSEDSEVCGMVFGLEELFDYKGFVGWD